MPARGVEKDDEVRKMQRVRYYGEKSVRLFAAIACRGAVVIAATRCCLLAMILSMPSAALPAAGSPVRSIFA